MLKRLYLIFMGIRTFVWWYNIDSLLEGGLTWSLGGYGSPAEKPDVTTSAPPNKATIHATPYKAPKPINPLISAMNHIYEISLRLHRHQSLDYLIIYLLKDAFHTCLIAYSSSTTKIFIGATS